MMNKPPPHNRDYNKDPNIQALKRKGFINHGSIYVMEFSDHSVYLFSGVPTTSTTVVGGPYLLPLTGRNP